MRRLVIVAFFVAFVCCLGADAQAQECQYECDQYTACDHLCMEGLAWTTCGNYGVCASCTPNWVVVGQQHVGARAYRWTDYICVISEYYLVTVEDQRCGQGQFLQCAHSDSTRYCPPEGSPACQSLADCHQFDWGSTCS
jgi:hypothetical protein